MKKEPADEEMDVDKDGSSSEDKPLKPSGKEVSLEKKPNLKKRRERQIFVCFFFLAHLSRRLNVSFSDPLLSFCHLSTFTL